MHLNLHNKGRINSVDAEARKIFTVEFVAGSDLEA